MNFFCLTIDIFTGQKQDLTKQKLLSLVKVSGHLPKNYFEPRKMKNLFQTTDQDMHLLLFFCKDTTVHTYSVKKNCIIFTYEGTRKTKDHKDRLSCVKLSLFSDANFIIVLYSWLIICNSQLLDPFNE